MAFSWIRSQAASALPVMGIALALANWNAKPAAAWAWAAAIAMFLVMVAVRQGFQFAFRHSSKFTQNMKRTLGDPDSDFRQDADVVKAGLARTIATVNNGVVFGAADDDHSPGDDTCARVWPRGRSNRRAPREHDHLWRVPGGDGERHAQGASAGHVEAASRCPHPGVSPACWLDLGALRPGIPDRVAGAADQDGRARVDGAGWCCRDRNRRPNPTPRSPDAAARSGRELITHHSSRGRRS